jgi:lipoprotein NlpD
VRSLAVILAAAATLAGCAGRSERPARAPAQSQAQAIYYTVRPGDTLSGIAGRVGVDMTALARANGLPPPYLIRVGQRLTLPPRGAYPRLESRPVVQPLPRYSPAPPPQQTLPPQAPPPSSMAAPRLVWPADGPVAERFGQGADPRGLAIAGHTGAAVRAAAGGTVIFAGAEPQRYGQLVVVDHGGGWVTAYGHLSRLVVNTGETVRANARLGFVGTTAGGEPRLHFELRRDNTPVDPLPRLPARF